MVHEYSGKACLGSQTRERTQARRGAACHVLGRRSGIFCGGDWAYNLRLCIVVLQHDIAQQFVLGLGIVEQAENGSEARS